MYTPKMKILLLILLFSTFFIYNLNGQHNFSHSFSGASSNNNGLDNNFVGSIPKTRHSVAAVFQIEKNLFMCNQKLYKSFSLAKKKCSTESLDSNINYPNDRACSSHGTPTRGIISCLRERLRFASANRFVNRYDFSTRAWLSIWGQCDYSCFSKNNFEMLKLKMVDEINLYRIRHRVSPLTVNVMINKLAQKRVEKIIQGEKYDRDNDKIYGEVFGMSAYFAGNIIVKKWYEEGKKYNYWLNRPTFATQMFTQIIWKGTKFIGIGIIEKGGVVYTVCKLYPRGNKKNEYRKNVLSVKKYIIFG